MTNTNLRIGFTERGDAGIDLSWRDKLITKRPDARFCEAVESLPADVRARTVVHTGITGWGGTWLEPNVIGPTEAIAGTERLLDAHLADVVLRIDPIVPTDEGLARVASVLRPATDRGLFARGLRLRISVLDEYRHVKARLAALGRPNFYPGDAFQATGAQLSATLDALAALVPTGTVVETCAEPALVKLARGRNGLELRACGCIDSLDLARMGITSDAIAAQEEARRNRQNRFGCCCLGCKTELLTRRQQCPHKCVYCYWK